MVEQVRGVVGFKIGGIVLTRLTYRVDEAAHILGLSETKIRELLEDGMVQAFCPNGVKKKPLCITTESMYEYYKHKLVPKEKWTE